MKKTNDISFHLSDKSGQRDKNTLHLKRSSPLRYCPTYHKTRVYRQLVHCKHTHTTTQNPFYISTTLAN
uniref:Uncharacterized protein n=1 Tax=Daphnia magna TaxID=35525 RepID=A0A0N8ENC2_9CRUS